MFNYIIVQHFTQIFMEKYIYKQYMLILERLPKHYYNNIFLFKYKPIALLLTNFLVCHYRPWWQIIELALTQCIVIRLS